MQNRHLNSTLPLSKSYFLFLVIFQCCICFQPALAWEEYTGNDIFSFDGEIRISTEDVWTHYSIEIWQNGVPNKQFTLCLGNSCDAVDAKIWFDLIPNAPDFEYLVSLIDRGQVAPPLGMGQWAEFEIVEIEVAGYQSKILKPTDCGDKWNLVLLTKSGGLIVSVMIKPNSNEATFYL